MKVYSIVTAAQSEELGGNRTYRYSASTNKTVMDFRRAQVGLTPRVLLERGARYFLHFRSCKWLLLVASVYNAHYIAQLIHIVECVGRKQCLNTNTNAFCWTRVVASTTAHARIGTTTRY